MAQTVVIETHGGPEVLSLVDRPVGDPGPGEIRIAHKACGLNFIDVYFRTGLYPAPASPFVHGMEGEGEIVEVGSGVRGMKVGDSVE